METSNTSHYKSFQSHLETFLSGMETQGLGLAELGSEAPLKPSLVEWKHHVRLHDGRGNGTLKPSLVEWKLSSDSFLSKPCQP